MLDLPPATLNPQATHDPCRNLADYALREAVRATAARLRAACDGKGGLRSDRFRRYHATSGHNEVTLEREIWFEKMGLSYIPRHWKGFAVMGAIILPTLGAMFLGQLALDRLGYGSVGWLAFPAFFTPALIFLLGVAKRHS
jgi:hypothetical protein